MKKIILGKLVKAAAIVLVLMSIMVYILQSAFSAFSANKTAQVRLADAVTSLQHGKEQVAVLTEQLNEDYIAKANSFAEMITVNPKILDDQDELNRINDLLGVDELHVTDERGVIRWGTIPEYFGFDFNTSEQTKPFIPILDDRSLEMAQEPQLNGAEGKLFQYISVGRHDARGIVQVGLEPDRLTQALAESQPDVLLGQLTVGTNGTMFAVSKADGLLAAYHDEAKLNTPAEEIGITEDILKLEAGSMKKFKIDGESYFIAITENDEYYIGAMLPASEVNGQTLTLTLIIVFMAAAVISLLIFLVSHAVNANIIDVITRIDVTMKRIADGEYDLRINENSCEEFTALSSGINDMLESIESKADETSELNHSMENLLSRVADISETINGFSSEMQNVSRKIADGSTSQAATVEELSAAFSNITNDVNENAAAASNANSMTEKSAAQLRISAEKMNQMQDSMMRITESSRKINNIVKTIDDIAFQTNILALNAAVEAARAGQHGKGFAVVADEVRTLANKSAEAAKNTTELIEETLRAIDNGTIIVDEAANELMEAISGINDSTKLIAEISVATSMQAHAINEAANGINQISQVIQVNSEISHNANGTAESLSTEADKLNSLVHSH